MKTGTIRRIDELGRIVIPKDIRQSLRIKSGDNLEIFIENENIIIKKYSELNKLIEIAQIIVDILKENLNTHILFTDNDKIIIDTKQKYQNENLSNELIKILELRKQEIKEEVKITEKERETGNILITPIIINGDVLGSIIIISNKIEENNIKIVNLLTSFLIKYIE